MAERALSKSTHHLSGISRTISRLVFLAERNKPLDMKTVYDDIDMIKHTAYWDQPVKFPASKRSIESPVHPDMEPALVEQAFREKQQEEAELESIFPTRKHHKQFLKIRPSPRDVAEAMRACAIVLSKSSPLPRAVVHELEGMWKIFVDKVSDPKFVQELNDADIQCVLKGLNDKRGKQGQTEYKIWEMMADEIVRRMTRIFPVPTLKDTRRLTRDERAFLSDDRADEITKKKFDKNLPKLIKRPDAKYVLSEHIQKSPEEIMNSNHQPVARDTEPPLVEALKSSEDRWSDIPTSIEDMPLEAPQVFHAVTQLPGDDIEVPVEHVEELKSVDSINKRFSRTALGSTIEALSTVGESQSDVSVESVASAQTLATTHDEYISQSEDSFRSEESHEEHLLASENESFRYRKLLLSYLRSYGIACDREHLLLRVPAVQRLARDISWIASGFKYCPEDLSSIIWATATLSERKTAIYARYGDALLSYAHTHEFTSGQLFHFVWAYSFADQFSMKNRDLWRFLFTGLLDKMHELPPGKIAVLMRGLSLSNADIRDQEFFRLTSEFFNKGLNQMSDLNELSHKEVAQIAIGMTKLGQTAAPVGFPVPQFCFNYASKLRDYILDQGQLLPETVFRSVLWSVAWYKKDKRPERQLLLMVADRMVKADTAALDDLSTMIWSMCRLKSRECPIEVVRKMSMMMRRDVKTLQHAQIASTLYGFAKLGVWCDELGVAISDRIIELLPSFSSSELTSVMWGYAVAGQFIPKLTVAWVDECIKRPFSNEKLPPKNFMGQKDDWVSKWTFAILMDEAPEIFYPFTVFDRMPGLKEKEGDLMVCSQAPLTSSGAHVDISRRIAHLGIPHVNEYSLDGMVVDIAIPASKVAIEIDGPWHFVALSDGTKRHDGASQWKHRRIQNAGWKVISLEVREFERCRSRYDYLRNILGDVLTDLKHKNLITPNAFQKDSRSKQLSERRYGGNYPGRESFDRRESFRRESFDTRRASDNDDHSERGDRASALY